MTKPTDATDQSDRQTRDPRTSSKFRIPFGTLSITKHAEQLIADALHTKRLSCGKYVREFERRFAELVGVREAVACSSGTDACVLALAALYDFGAQRGDEVIVPALSFAATAHAALHAGFTPLFVDVRRETLNIDVDQIEIAITPKTRAIVPVHLMGKPADMDPISAIAKKHNLYVIEDAAEAHGAQYKGTTAGTMGDMGAFSLYVAHIISSVEGGMVTTNRDEFVEVLISLRAHGRGCSCRNCVLSASQTRCDKRWESGEDSRFRFERIGYSAKMNELEAAIGLGAVEQYHETLRKRRENLLYALERFDRFAPYLTTIREEPHEKLGPHALPILVQENSAFTRPELMRYMEQEGIETRTLFSSIPTQCPGFSFLGHHPGQFPNSEYVGKWGIHVGVHQDLEIEDMQYLLDVLEQFLESHCP